MSNGQKKVVTSVTLDPEAQEYISTIAGKVERSRSWVINALIKKHARLVKEKVVDETLPDLAVAVINL